MKKNKFLKLASGLLVLCLLTTCVISTTFAKYTTSGDAQDTARVAKWGVEIAVQADDAFSNKYNDFADAAGTKVISIDGKDVVAPGTKGTLTQFSITGTPEVAVKLDFVVTTGAGADKAQDVYLGADTYKDWTTAPTDDTFDVTDDYHPIKFTIKKDGTAVSGYEGVTLAKVEEYIEGLTQAEVAPNTTLDATYIVEWAWDYGTGVYDKEDTLLGNVIAGIDTSVTDYSTTIDFKITITATQID